MGSLIIACVLSFANGRARPRPSPSGIAAVKIGERLFYRVDWRNYSGAAEAELDVVDRANFYGANLWHLRAVLHTLEPARALYPLDDHFDSYDSPGGFATFRFHERLREFGKLQESNLDFVSPGSPSSNDSPRVIVPPGTRDPVSAIYFLRRTDWQQITEARIPVYDGEDLYDMLADREASEEIRVAAGDFSAIPITIRLFENGREVPDARFKIWLARDAAQTPIIFRAQLPVGSVRAQLTSPLEARKIPERGAPFNPPARSSRPAGN
ncbi:MAG TPA: DUF3108 domain-containing protein [Candidatus Acidoferrales bacterium]|nr:DUF3108 domain-containing protein [Candidatus Acidoferrales bacterium]